MTEGISRAIGELAAAQRLSATSVMVTSPHWPATAPRLRVHRGHLSVGLHLNLTLGRPLGPMPRLAPAGTLAEPARPDGAGPRSASAGPGRDPRRDRAPARSLRDRPALSARPRRRPPARPRAAGRQGCAARRGGAALSADGRRWCAIRRTGSPPRAHAARLAAKAMSSGCWPPGFAHAAGRRGLPVNDSFAGFSDFDVSSPYADELARALREPGRRHLVMCHPGHPDAELARLDPVVARRRMEYDALMRGREPALAHLAAVAQGRRAARSPGRGCRTEPWPGRRTDRRLAPSIRSVTGWPFSCRAAWRSPSTRWCSKLLTRVLRRPPDRRPHRGDRACHGGGLADAPHLHVRSRGTRRALPSSCATPAWRGRRRPSTTACSCWCCWPGPPSSRWWRSSSPRPWPWHSPTSACALRAFRAARAAGIASPQIGFSPSSFSSCGISP